MASTVPVASQPVASVLPTSRLVELQQKPYDAQSSRRNMSLGPVNFFDVRTGMQGIKLSEALDQNLQSVLQDPNAEVLNENVGQKLSYRLQVRSLISSVHHQLMVGLTCGYSSTVTRASLDKNTLERRVETFALRGRKWPNK